MNLMLQAIESDQEENLCFEDYLSSMESTWWRQSYFFQSILMKR